MGRAGLESRGSCGSPQGAPETQPKEVREDFLEEGVSELRPGGWAGRSKTCREEGRLCRGEGGHHKFRQLGFSACAGGSLPEKLMLDSGTGSMDPIVHLTEAVVI